MSLPNLLYLYRRRLRARLVQELLALVGIAVGVALLFAVQVSSTSLTASVVELRAGLVGAATLEVSARGARGFDETIARSVAAVPGVRQVAPSIDASVNLVGPHGERSATLLAADGRLAAMGGTLLQSFADRRLLRRRSVLLSAGMAASLGARVGDVVEVQVRGEATAVPVGAIFDEDDVGTLSESPIAMMPFRHGQRLVGMRGRISQLFLVTAPDRADEAAAAVQRRIGPGLDVDEAGHDRVVFEQLVETTDRTSSLFAGISAVVGFLFAFNAIQLVARDRRRLVVELRLSGYGIPAVLKILLSDALVLGIAGSLLGLALGEALSRFVFEPAPGFLAFAFPVGTARTVEPKTIAIAVAAGTGASLAATAASLAGVRATDAVDRVEPARGSRRSLRAAGASAVVLLGASLAILAVAPSLALLGMATLVASTVAVLPVALTLVLRGLERTRGNLRGSVPVIAIGELRAAGNRSAALITIIGVAVLACTAIEGAHQDLEAGLDGAAAELNAGTGIWVAARGDANHLTTQPLPASISERIAGVPGVERMLPYRGEFLDVHDRRTWVIAPSASARRIVPAGQMIAGDGALAEQRLREGGWAVLSRSLADELDVGLGGSFVLPSPDPMTLRVAGITTNLGWAGGSIVLSSTDHRRAWSGDEISALQVHGDDEEALRRSLAARLAGMPAVEVFGARERESRFRTSTREGLARLTQISALVLMGAALAMAAAMAGMIWQRRLGLATLKLEGMDDRSVWRALLFETGLLVGTGAVVGAMYGLLGQQLLDRALEAVTGFPVQPSLGLAVALVSVAAVSAVAVLVASVPGFVAARVPVSVAFQD